MNSLTEDELLQYRGLLAQRLEKHATQGGFELVQPADLTVARRASS